MFKCRDSALEIVAIGVGRAAILVVADWFANGGLREGGGERDGLNDSTSCGIVRGTGVYGESAKAVYRTGRAWWRFNGMVGEGHDDGGVDLLMDLWRGLGLEMSELSAQLIPETILNGRDRETL